MVAKGCAWTVNSTDRNPNWDIDLRDGKVGEATVAKMLSVETVEVKTDRRWHVTGNIYVETEYYSREKGDWVASGITTSEASHWAYVLEGMVIMVPTDDLRHIVRGYGSPIRCNIEPNPSKGMLIKFSHFAQYFGGRLGNW